MRIQLNGESVEIHATTVAELLAARGLDPRTVAVELNREILPRDRFAETRLTAGDEVEFVRFVQGG